ncbi:lipocalin family protein [Aquimarina agarivorans]|uniref:lipocalin family protein n=1 Tax=Aquimarina agarivorans TaxID=980584 RepID=UPI001110F769|nr:lipocalin family protein [Aquimarina agarivorans]
MKKIVFYYSFLALFLLCSCESSENNEETMADTRTTAVKLQGVWQLVKIISDGGDDVTTSCKRMDNIVVNEDLTFVDTAHRFDEDGDCVFWKTTNYKFFIENNRGNEVLFFQEEGDSDVAGTYKFVGDQLELVYITTFTREVTVTFEKQ